jgi:uncharacterized protein YnzC (UPF0291/DUF896 family)
LTLGLIILGELLLLGVMTKIHDKQQEQINEMANKIKDLESFGFNSHEELKFLRKEYVKITKELLEVESLNILNMAMWQEKNRIEKIFQGNIYLLYYSDPTFRNVS